MNRKTVIGLTIGVLFLVVLGLVLRIFLTAPPEPTYDLNAPNVIAISQGTEGELLGLSIGVTFVDRTSAGASLFTDGETQEQIVFNEGETHSYGEFEVQLLDAQASENTAVFEVVQNQ